MDFAEITCEEKNVIAEYFTEDQWNKLLNWEKTRNYVTLQRYLAFKDYKGLNFPPPDFMLERKKLTDVFDTKQPSDRGEAVSIKGTTAKRKSLRLGCVSNCQISSSSKKNVDHFQPQKTESNHTKGNNKSEENTGAPSKKYPKRSVPAKNYYEPDEPNDDRYVYCDNCEEDCVDYCKICGKLAFLKDYPVRMNTRDRAMKTCPKGVLVVRPSKIHGFGVFTLQSIPKGVQMGPYEGQVAKQETESGYAWKLRRGKLIDAADERNSNYLRYVNCARYSAEQNLVAFQYEGKLFYRTCKNILPNEELLVYYGHSFAKTLGIDPKQFYEPNINKIEDYYTCQYCHIGLSTQQFRDVHEIRCRFRPSNIRETFDANQAVACQQCCRIFRKDEDLEKHESKCIRKKKLMKKPLFRNAEVKQFKCCECSYSTNYVGNLKEHGIIHSKEGRKKFACSQCDFSTYHKQNLISHISRIHSSNPIKFCCKGCKKTFKTKVSLDHHILQQHPSLIESVSNKIHSCSVCQYKTTYVSHFRMHLLIHSKENARRFQCFLCQYTTYRKSDYNQHMKIHLKVKPMRCIECGEGFAQKIQLDGHILIHHIDNIQLMESITNKIHSCQHCNYKTVQYGNFKCHMNKHKL